MRVFLALILFAIGTNVSAQVEEEKDRFTGDTKLATTFKAVIDGKLRPKGLVTIQNGKVTEIEIILSGAWKEWKYLQCNDTHWLINGSKVEFPKTSHTGSVLHNGYVVEYVIVHDISVEALQQIGDAKLVEFKVCNDEYKFSDHDLAAFHELAQRTLQAAKK